MSGRPLLPIALAAALAGVVLAALLAFALRAGDERAGTDAGAVAAVLPATAPPAAAGDPARPAIGRARRDVRGWRQSWMRALGPVHVEARAADPRGGPPWALRIFRTQRQIERRDGSLRPAGRPQWCAQLGRELDGRFGWIDGGNVFRASEGIVFRSNPIRCAALRDDLGRQPQIELLTRVTDPERGAPTPLQSVAWGFAGAAARSLEVTIDGRARRVRPSPNGGLLLPLPASPRRAQLQALVRYPDGGPILVDDSFAGSGAGTASTLRELGRPGGAAAGPEAPPAALGAADRRHLAPVPLRGPVAPPVLDYRITDPTTGQALGMVAARTRGGRWCASDLGLVAGDRVGEIDRGLGTFRDARPSYGSSCGTAGARTTRARPLSYGWSLNALPGGIEPESAAARRWRTQRRTLAGTTRIHGAAHRDVVSITIASPRDVRTVVPSPRAHVFAVVYDGGFPAGEIAISARMRDGTIHRERPLAGG